eukprot:537139_1
MSTSHPSYIEMICAAIKNLSKSATGGIRKTSISEYIQKTYNGLSSGSRFINAIDNALTKGIKSGILEYQKYSTKKYKISSNSNRSTKPKTSEKTSKITKPKTQSIESKQHKIPNKTTLSIQSHSYSKWISLSDNNNLKEYGGNTIVSDGQHYMVLDEYNIWKYNCDRDTWTNVMDEENNSRFSFCSASLSTNGQELFVLKCHGSKKHQKPLLMKIHLNDNSFDIIHDEHISEFQPPDSQIVVINDTIHVIGGDKNSSHWIWNEQNEQFTKITEMYNNLRLCGFGLIHSKRTNCLLLFGGLNNDALMDHILEFNIQTQSWNKLPVSLPKCLWPAGYTMALNNQYVIICGGDDAMDDAMEHECDGIYIYDIQNKLIKESEKKCPIKGSMFATTIHNDLYDEKAVYGYARRQWSESNNNHYPFPPLYILNIIKAYFYREYIYLLGNNSGRHYKIDTLDIFQTSSDLTI